MTIYANAARKRRRSLIAGWQIMLLAIQAVFASSSMGRASDALLVDNGRPRAEIVIAEKPTRTQRLAANELRSYIEKMSGARLPIVTKPTGDEPVKVYVGRSEHTDKRGVTAEGLRDGAYRAVSGPDWLVLLGDDTDFTPAEPWARSNSDIPRMQQEWEKLAGAPWGAPNRGLYKNRLRLPGEVGKPDGAKTEKNEKLELWAFDERGSFNAVCGFLRRLGVRWYLPGEIGEIMPSIDTIPLPKIDETVRPDFSLRQFNFRFGVVGVDTAMWAMRLGLRESARLEIAHGMANMTGRDEIFARHPDWFALYGGKRRYEIGYSKNQLCYSNEELFSETVRYARALFDRYDLDSVSIMPPDGYTAICQCPLCEGKDSPERNNRGLLSDHVWDFVNRVAKEIGKTHPGKKILCCAYGVYTLPPLKIEKLEPNVLVCIVGGRRPIDKGNGKFEGESAPDVLREAWVKKTDNPLLVFENYPFTDRGWYLPSFVPHALGETVNATKGVSQGEDIWLSVGRDFDRSGIGFNHFQTYFTARMYWGGKQADVDAMFREYCWLFYGPVEKEMLAFFTYCEVNWRDMEKDKSKADTALALFDVAKAKADSSSVYGKRLALIDDYLNGLRRKSAQLAQRRGVVPQLRLVGEPRNPIVVDGKLDDEPWENCPVASTGRFRELQTGREPTFGATVKSAWIGGNLYFAVRCDEHPGEKLNITAVKDGDAAIWYGDAVEFLIETDSHSYYQIAVSPSGAIVDLDRGASAGQQFHWDSKAQAATNVADNHWTLEIRIPITQDENDPLHQVIGRKPTQSLPWHVNICRQRVRDDGSEFSAFSPTGTNVFHTPMKFAHFYMGKNHQFEADPTATDFLSASRAAESLMTQRNYEKATDAFLALADGKVPDLQKSVALQQAAAAARARKEFDRADEIAAKIPIDAVKKTTLMQNLLSRSGASAVVEQYASEDIGSWPFWQRGEGYAVRGLARSAAKAGREADADLIKALEFTSNARERKNILLAMGRNRERNLNDDPGALAAYREVYEGSDRIGSADEYWAVQSAARILKRQGKFDDALAVLARTEAAKLRGHWRNAFLVSIGETQAAAGRNEEARNAFQAVLDDPAAEQAHRKAAQQGLQDLKR